MRSRSIVPGFLRVTRSVRLAPTQYRLIRRPGIRPGDGTGRLGAGIPQILGRLHRSRKRSEGSRARALGWILLSTMGLPSGALAGGYASGARRRLPIKGIINRKGVKIYHPPWSRWYKWTKIDTSKGERWFRSESEAMAAGWRVCRSDSFSGTGVCYVHFSLVRFSVVEQAVVDDATLYP